MGTIMTQGKGMGGNEEVLLKDLQKCLIVVSNFLYVNVILAVNEWFCGCIRFGDSNNTCNILKCMVVVNLHLKQNKHEIFIVNQFA